MRPERLFIALLVAAAPLAVAQDAVIISQGATQFGGGAALQVEAQAAPPTARGGGGGHESDALAQMEIEARIDLALSEARLVLVQARQALAAGELERAAGGAQQVLRLLEQLPGQVDASAYGLQAEGILARVRKAGLDVDTVTYPPLPLAANPQVFERKLRAAGQIAQNFEGADQPAINTTGDLDDLAQRTLAAGPTDEFGYRPGRAIIDVGDVMASDEQRLHYQAALAKAYGADEVRRLVNAQEARVAPIGNVSYPDNWKQRTRGRDRSGMIARTDSWRDDEGREWYVAVYDIHDLIYVPPDFNLPFGLNPAEEMRWQQDRAALRYYSWIYRGWPSDLATGIPLLRYFGGVDDFALRGPKYSLEREQQIVDMIEAFTAHLDQPPGKVVALPPIQRP